jgi:hypothetical protein
MAAHPFSKVDVVHHLLGCFGYRRYLEIATPTTGNFYAQIDRGRLDDCRRLLYNAPPDFSDGMVIDYACPGFDISAALSAIAAQRRRFDIILVDPYHLYEPSRRDLDVAFALLEPGGAMVIHDCRPPNEAVAQPDYRPGEWCGVTYKAYLDFVLGRTDLRYLTVDTDYGCGVVRKAPAPVSRRLKMPFGRHRRLRGAIVRWNGLGNDYTAAWRYFEANNSLLLNLTSVSAFVSRARSLL